MQKLESKSCFGTGFGKKRTKLPMLSEATAFGGGHSLILISYVEIISVSHDVGRS
jgi:hypothetical protein